MEEFVACKAKNVKQESINLLYLVYLVDRTTLKDQIDIKVSTLFRNMYEERHVFKELSTQAVHLLTKFGKPWLILRTDGNTVIQENTPKYSLTSVGLVENAVKQVKEKVRQTNMPRTVKDQGRF